MSNIQVPGKLEPLYEDCWRYIILEGGRGGAKSHGIATSQIVRGSERPMLFLDAREVQKSIKDSVHSLLEKKISELGFEDFYEVLDTEIRGENGTKFIFAGLGHNIGNIKSIEDVDECWVEEADVVSDYTWQKLIPTIRKEISPCCFSKLDMGDDKGKPCKECKKMIPLDKIIPSRIVISYNPDLREDPTYQRFHEKRPTNSKLIQMNYRDNPWFPEVLRQEMEDLKESNYEEYLHVYEGECRAAVVGAVFAKEMARAGKITEEYPSSRITKVPYEKAKPVDIHYDLGRANKTAMWFVQIIGYEIRLIDYYENHGEHFSHYIQYAQERPYVLGNHYLPHDGDLKHVSARESVKKQAINAYGSDNVKTVRRIPKKAMAIAAIFALSILNCSMSFPVSPCASLKN